MVPLNTRRFTDAGSYHLNVVPLSREHRDTETDKYTEPMSTAASSVIQDQAKEPVKIKSLCTVANERNTEKESLNELTVTLNTTQP